MKYRVVQNIEACFVTSHFTDETLIPAMEVRGHSVVRLNANSHQRTELQGQPIFTGLLGPMWDGDAIRYEDQTTYDLLSS